MLSHCLSNREDKSAFANADLHPIVDELRTLVEGGDYSLLLRRAVQLTEHVRRSSDQAALAHDLGRLAAAGPIAAIAAIESLAEVEHQLADDHLIDLLSHPEQLVRRHAAWRLGDRRPSERAIPVLIELLIVGGIDTMHAHQTLRSWSAGLGARSFGRRSPGGLPGAPQP